MKWTLPTLFYNNATASIGADDTIYFCSGGTAGFGCVCAVSPEGLQLWYHGFGLQSSVALGTNGTIYTVLLWPTALIAIDPTTKTDLWRRGGGENPRGYLGIPSTPAVAADGVIYYGSLDSNAGAALYAINPDGTTNWIFATGGERVGSPTIARDGTVYVVADVGFFALKGNTPLAKSAWPKLGQNPRNTGKVEWPRLHGLTRMADRVQVELFADPGWQCMLQASSNLLHWTTLTNFVAVTNRTFVTEEVAPETAQRFYRVLGADWTNPWVPPFPAPSNMVWIAPGTFTMGSPTNEPARWSDEGPQTQVTLTKGFFMGKFEVTQGEYLAVMGVNPSGFNGGAYGTNLSRPVEQVTWNGAVAYCAAFTARERAGGRLSAQWEYRLPTEAQWEYACRAGTTTPFHYGNELRSGMANFNGHAEYLVGDPYHVNPSGIYLAETTTVGSYAPNAWGLYDMHGNVWEWCQDWYASSLPGGSVTDPQGSPTGLVRVFRGGCWDFDALYCRSALKRGYPNNRFGNLGFRVALVPVP